MKFIEISNLITLGLALTFAATGCKTQPQSMKPLPGQRSTVGGGNRLPPEAPRFNPNPTPTDMGARPPGGPVIPFKSGTDYSTWVAHPDILKDQTVYFDFDKSAIKASEQSKLEAVAAYLKAHAGTAVRVEGNCDERGTEEYNRSLGSRRALSAREHLAQSGIDPNRVDAISYGEDKPAEPGHNEAAWSKNRRDDFILLTPP